MTPETYLDYHATTPVDPRVLDAMWPYFAEHFGNPSSRTHTVGRKASRAVDEARARIAQALQAAGFGEIRSRTIEIELSATVAEYLADRAMGARGRLARHLLGPDGWSRCSASLDGLFRERFGTSFTYHRQVLIAAGRKRETE